MNMVQELCYQVMPQSAGWQDVFHLPYDAKTTAKLQDLLASVITVWEPCKRKTVGALVFSCERHQKFIGLKRVLMSATGEKGQKFQGCLPKARPNVVLILMAAWVAYDMQLTVMSR